MLAVAVAVTVSASVAARITAAVAASSATSSFAQLCSMAECDAHSLETVVGFVREAIRQNNNTLLRDVFDGLAVASLTAAVPTVLQSFSNFMETFHSAVHVHVRVHDADDDDTLPLPCWKNCESEACKSDALAQMTPLSSSVIFRYWFFHALSLHDTVQYGMDYMLVWTRLGRFLLPSASEFASASASASLLLLPLPLPLPLPSLSLSCVEACLDFLLHAKGSEGDVDRAFTADEITFSRQVLLPFMTATPDRLHPTDLRMRVWSRLVHVPYYLMLVFSALGTAELRLLFKNDPMLRRVQSIVTLGLTTCDVKCVVAYHTPTWRDEQLSFSARLIALDPMMGNADVSLMLLRVMTDPRTCRPSFTVLLCRLLDGFSGGGSPVASDMLAFWRSLLLNAAVCATGGAVPRPSWGVHSIFQVVAHVFSRSASHLHALRTLIIDEVTLAAQLQHVNLLGDVYVWVLQAYSECCGSTVAAWRLMFPTHVAAATCAALSRADIGEKLMLHAVALLPRDNSLLLEIAATVRQSADIFCLRDTCLYKMLLSSRIVFRPCLAGILEIFGDLLTPSLLLRNDFGRLLVSSAVVGSAAALAAALKVVEVPVPVPVPVLTNLPVCDEPIFKITDLEYDACPSSARMHVDVLNLSERDAPIRPLLRQTMVHVMQHREHRERRERREFRFYTHPAILKEATDYGDVLDVLAKLRLPRRFVEQHLIDYEKLAYVNATATTTISDTIESLTTNMKSQRMSWITACVALSKVSCHKSDTSHVYKASRVK